MTEFHCNNCNKIKKAELYAGKRNNRKMCQSCWDERERAMAKIRSRRNG